MKHRTTELPRLGVVPIQNESRSHRILPNPNFLYKQRPLAVHLGGSSFSLFLSTIVEPPRSKNSRKLHYHLYHHSKHQTKTTPISINQIPINPNSPTASHNLQNTRNQSRTTQNFPGCPETEKEPNRPLNLISGSHLPYQDLRLEKNPSNPLSHCDGKNSGFKDFSF